MILMLLVALVGPVVLPEPLLEESPLPPPSSFLGAGGGEAGFVKENGEEVQMIFSS